MKHVACIYLATLAIGCGGSQPAPKAEDAPKEETHDSHAAHHNGPSVSQELGEIDQKEAERAFGKAQPQISACQKTGSSRVDYLSGELHVFLRIDANGQVRWSYFEGTTIGDRATEKCILDVLARVQWPRPSGGEAEVRKAFQFDGGDAREPTQWDKDKMFDAIARSQSSVEKCKAGVKGSFAVTAYVVPDGSGGKVEAAGVAPPSKEGESKVDCIVDVVKSMKPPSPGSYAAKVSFTL